MHKMFKHGLLPAVNVSTEIYEQALGNMSEETMKTMGVSVCSLAKQLEAVSLSFVLISYRSQTVKIFGKNFFFSCIHYVILWQVEMEIL